LRIRKSASVAALSLGLLGCGDHGEPHLPPAGVDAGAAFAAPVPPVAVPSFQCEQGVTSEPDALRRLTMTQYKNTVRDLVRGLLGDALEAEAAVSEAGLDSVPVDRRLPSARDARASYKRLDQAVDQSHVDATVRVATALAAALTTPARLGRVVGTCATDADASNDANCLTTFIHRFGARALRRPLEADDERFYRVVYGAAADADPVAYADVIAVMLSAPELLYFVEHGQAELADEPGVYQLSAYELAARLSYHFWQTLPDEELWQTAEDGSLLLPEVQRHQVARLLADPRTRATMAELFSDWLGLDDLPALDARVHDPLYAAFAGADLPGPALREHVIDDALDMLAYYTWTNPQGVAELFSSELSFARTVDLARIYGTRVWEIDAEPPALPAGARPGLLTRAWFLASGSANTRPVLRGAFVRHRLLCDELAPPPANVNAMPPELAPDRTTRQVVEALTEQAGTACASCHQTQINPLGFAFEGFDALGRARREQPLFRDDGEQVGSAAVDTSSVPRVTDTDPRATRGPAELVQRMLESGKLEACLARNYFRFTFGREEQLARDGCALERLRARLVESGRIRDMLEEAALLPELRKRRFTP
jgi:Protein of unknown function (DUF1588)/Protein of unknown function (DUF1592)/Protein of unknown function (DUF1595)/Protein of unknown function (DUF1585)